MESSQADSYVPTLDIKSIIEILTTLGLGCKLTPKDFKNPSIETMVLIYLKFLESCISVSPNLFEMDPSDALLHFDQETLKTQMESFKFLQFYVLVQYFFDICSIPEKEFNGIFHPTKKAFIKNISTMINFSRFEFEALPDFSAAQEQNKEYVAECERLKRENDEMKRNVRFLEAKTQTEKEPIENAKKRIQNLKDKLLAAREQRKKISNNRDLVRKEDESITHESNQLKIRQQEIQKKMILYEKLLVRSPERLNRDLEKNEARIAELKKHVEAKRLEKEGLRCDLFEREKFVENFKQIKENVENFYNNDIKKGIEKIKEAEVLTESITSLKFDIKHLDSSIQTQQTENEKINSDITRLRQQIEKEMMQFKDKDDSFKQMLKECVQKIDELKSKQTNMMEQREKFIKKFQLFQSEAFENIIQWEKNDERSKKAFETKMNTITNIDKEAKRAIESTNELQTKLFDFLKQI